MRDKDSLLCYNKPMNKANYPYLKKLCPYCKEEREVVKIGSKRGQPYVKCRECGNQFTDDKKTLTNKTYSKAIKFLAVNLHRISRDKMKISYATIAKILEIKRPSSIYGWDSIEGKDDLHELNKQEYEEFLTIKRDICEKIEEVENKTIDLTEIERKLYCYREDIISALERCTEKLNKKAPPKR